MRDFTRCVELQSSLSSSVLLQQNHGHHHKRKLKLGAQQEARSEFWIPTVDEVNVGRKKASAAQSCRDRREEGKQSRVCVFISGARLWERSGGCRAEVEEHLGGAATPACSPSEPQSHTSSRGAQLSSAGRSRRVNTHRGGGGLNLHSLP